MKYEYVNYNLKIFRNYTECHAAKMFAHSEIAVMYNHNKDNLLKFHFRIECLGEMLVAVRGVK